MTVLANMEKKEDSLSHRNVSRDENNIFRDINAVSGGSKKRQRPRNVSNSQLIQYPNDIYSSVNLSITRSPEDNAGSMKTEDREDNFEASADSFISIRSFSREESSSFCEIGVISGGFRKRKRLANGSHDQLTPKKLKLEWEEILNM